MTIAEVQTLRCRLSCEADSAMLTQSDAASSPRDLLESTPMDCHSCDARIGAQGLSDWRLRHGFVDLLGAPAIAEWLGSGSRAP